MNRLRLKNWLFLFFSTLVIGGVTAVAVGFYMEAGEVTYGSAREWVVGGLGYLGSGLMFSIVSQMGFFAYLTVHYFALHLFRAKWVWQTVQIVLILFIFGDTVYLRHLFFGAENEGFVDFLTLPGLLLLYALLIAIWKAKLTSMDAFVPTVFFMFVVTILEAFPSLKSNNALAIQLMVTTLLACNTWQILQLHRLVNRKQKNS